MSYMQASLRVRERRCYCIQNMIVHCAAQSIFLCTGSGMEHPSRVAFSKPGAASITVRINNVLAQCAWNKRWNRQALVPPWQIQAQVPKLWLGLCPCSRLSSGQGREQCNSYGEISPSINLRPKKNSEIKADSKIN